MQLVMHLINLIFFLCGAAVVVVAIWQLTTPGMTTGAVGIVLWVMLGTGILTLLLSLWGCVIASSQSKSGLCCYGFIMIIALVVTVLYVIAGGVASGLISGATECGFNPNSVTGTDCKSLEGIMNATATAYMGASSLCNPSGKPTYLGGGGVVCQSGDKWTQNLINSACPVEPNPDDISNCSLLLIEAAPEGGDEDMAKQAASLFCMCPARFTYVYVTILNDSIIPGAIQAVVLFLLVMSACFLMCMPKRRAYVMQHYYMTQSPSQTPSQTAQGTQAVSQNHVNTNKAGHAYV